MRRKTITGFAALIIILFSLCLNAQVYDTLNINNVNARFSSKGILSWNGGGLPDPEPILFEIPNGSGKHTIWSSEIWFAGIDMNEVLHIAAHEERESSELWEGPVADTYDSEYSDNYNKIYKINKSEIDDHIANWNTGGYIIPSSIAGWPAHGDTSNGEAFYLAPFFDYNDDDIYNPENGDYPEIRGDQALFLILNDDRDEHLTTDGEKLKIEIHMMAYSYSTSGCLNDVIFVNYEIYNRSSDNYHDCYVGIFGDFDIGLYSDDYAGCDPDRNTFFGYNGDNMDGNGTGGTYGDEPPAQGITFLSSPMTSYINFDMEYSNTTGYPVDGDEFYNYMKAIWRDGTHLQFGGTGHLSGGNETNFAYPEGSGWTEVTEGHVPTERRGIGALGPFNLISGEHICFDIAYTWAFAVPGKAYESVGALQDSVDCVQAFYDSQGYDCPEIIHIVIEENIENTGSRINIYPNPTDGVITIDSEGIEIEKTEIYNLLGSQVRSYNKQSGQIDISDLKNGIYIIKICEKNGFPVKYEKVVKN